ncbi:MULTISPECIES: hypothetical protein [Bacillaceae]|nr:MULTISPECIES: hypothetical protein [Bacillaceae]MED4473605.1 hypothetical protein [Oceanobacillus caeni]
MMTYEAFSLIAQFSLVLTAVVQSHKYFNCWPINEWGFYIVL